MSYQINLGQWNKIFAVPASVVDQHIKLASEAQIKVLLYLLRHSDANIEDITIAEAIGITADEVQNAVDFWIERNLICRSGETLIPSDAADRAMQEEDKKPVTTTPEKPHTAPSRAVRPDSFFVSKLLKEDANLAGLLEEAQTVLNKPLSPGDTATLVMLYDSFGLPCEVIAMLIHYLASTDSANMRSIEKLGIRWSDDGIISVSDAENEIMRMEAYRDAWGRVSSLMGIRNIGHPTKSQMQHADRWLNTWHFNDEMIIEAYERCVNNKGEYNIRYINAILQKWYDKGIKSLDALAQEESSAKNKSGKKKQNAKGSVYSVENASFDVSKYESQSLFDD